LGKVGLGLPFVSLSPACVSVMTPRFFLKTRLIPQINSPVEARLKKLLSLKKHGGQKTEFYAFWVEVLFSGCSVPFFGRVQEINKLPTF
jgi:hypothetical protein